MTTHPPDDQPDPHRCRRGPRCAAREHTDTGPTGALIALPGLCDPDRTHLARALAPTGLPDLWAALRDLVEPGSTGDGPARGTRDAPLPLRAHPAALADRIAYELLGWERIVRDRLGMTPRPVRIPRTIHAPRPAVDRRHIDRAAQLLRDAQPTLLALAPRELLRWDTTGRHQHRTRLDGIDAATLLVDLHQTATTAAGRGRLVHHLAVPCPRCDHRTLQRTNGDDHVTCQTCGNSYDEPRYRFLVKILVQDLADAARCPDCDPLGQLPTGELCPHPTLTAAP